MLRVISRHSEWLGELEFRQGTGKGGKKGAGGAENVKMRLQLGDVVSSQVGAEGMGLVTVSAWKWGRQSVKKDWGR